MTGDVLANLVPVFIRRNRPHHFHEVEPPEDLHEPRFADHASDGTKRRLTLIALGRAALSNRSAACKIEEFSSS